MLLRAKPRCWLWGLIPLILFGVLIVYATQGVIERDLSRRSLEALKAEGLDWARPRFYGLTGTIEGEAPSDQERGRAVKVVKNVWGVRTVVDQLSLSPEISPYKWSAAYYDGKMLLEGYVPNNQVHQSVIGLIKAKFPQAKISDKLKNARGVDDEGQWFGQVSFGLGQLALMSNGEVKLIDDQLSLRGTANDLGAFNGLTARFSEALPLDLKSGKIDLQAPLIKDYDMAIKQGDGVVSLDGYVADERDRIGLIDEARRLFPAYEVKANLNLGSGAPFGWIEAIKLSLGLLSDLSVGDVQVNGRDVRIKGVASDKQRAKAVRLKARSDYPTGYQVNDEIEISELEKQRLAEEEAARLKAEEDARLKAEKEEAEAERLAEEKAKAEAEAARLAAEEAARKREEEAALAAKLEKEKAEAEAARLAAAEKAKAEAEAAKRASEEAAAKREAEEAAAKQAAERAKEAEEKAEANAENEEDTPVNNAEELAKKREWLSPEETRKRLEVLHRESAAVTAKECQLLMNSIVRGSAIRFGVNSSVINPNSYDVLAKVTSVASRCGNTVIRIEGHTDSDGSDAYNLELSKRRARAVIAYLVGQGVPKNRLDAKGFGEKKPVASNNSGQGKALNRRIEFVVFEN